MRLNVGDEIVCYNPIGDLVYGKTYTIIRTREKSKWCGDDICIDDNDKKFDGNWWFGQIGETECWTNWFVTKKEWIRDNKLNELLK